jgi:signal transduction histidine kinase/CheY-like chemotaxis protein
VLAAVIGGIPILVLAVATVAVADRAIRDEVDLRMRSTATVSAQRVDEAMNAGAQPIATSAANPAIVNLTAGRLDGTVTEDTATGVLARTPRRATVKGTFLAGLDGRLLAATGASTDDALRADWITELRERAQPTFVSNAFDLDEGGRGAAILGLISGPGGAPIGALGAVFDLQAIQSFVDGDASGDDVLITVYDRNGAIVARPTGITPVDLDDLDADDDLTRRRADGQRLLGARGEAATVGWVIVAETPERVALARIGDVKRSVAVVAALLLAGLGVVIAFVVRADRRRREAEEEWRLAHERAIEASLHKSEFLANMSHEIRTPLNGVLGLTTLLVDSDLSPDQRELAEMAHRSGEALLSIINEVLDFSRIEAGRVTIEIIDFDLRSLVEDVSQLLAASAETKGIELVCSVDEGVPSRVRGDPTRVRQILTNLAGNAVKFTEQGSVVVRASVEQTTDDGLVARLAVVDTGAGIDHAAQEHLFEPFTQADASTTRRFGGSGLGLSISQRLAHLMGGDIGFESELGVGSTFWFTVPLQPAAQLVSAPVPAVRDIDVLIVDDNDTNRRVLEGLAAARGMRTRSATGGAEALRMLRALADEGAMPDVVLLDLNMPDVDGFEVTAEIRRTYGATPRIVLLTSSAQRGEARRSQEAGIDGYLSKPVRRAELFEVIAAVMGRTPDQDQLVTRHLVREARRRATILLAEDNPVNQRVASAMLERLGHRVVIAGDGAETVATFQAGTYDVILMDCQMPVLDGFDATRQIRAAEGDERRTPIIALTASATAADRQACLDAGMDDHLSKPIQPSQLEAALDRWFEPTSSDPPAAVDPEPAPSAAAIDESVLRAIVDVDGESLLTNLIEVFEADAIEQLATIRTALDIGDLQTVRLAAHRLKGGSAAIGAASASEACARLEHAADANRAAAVGEEAEAVQRLVRDSIAMLRAWSPAPTA